MEVHTMTDVVAALRDLGRNIDYPAGDDLGDAVAARIAGELPAVAPIGRRRVLLVCAAAVLALVVVLALPQPREAVARWFGLSGVRLTLTEDGLPAGVGTDLDLGRSVTAAEAIAAVPFAVSLPADLGPPSEAFAGRPPDSVSFVWAPIDELPPVDGSGVGLLLTEFPGSTDDQLVVKQIGPGTQVQQVRVGDNPGYWITGARHTVTYLDPEREPRFDPVRLAGNTLLWSDDGVLYRMEANLGLAEMQELAESFTGVD
jgi:hypothetical protein